MQYNMHSGVGFTAVNSSQEFVRVTSLFRSVLRTTNKTTQKKKKRTNSSDHVRRSVVTGGLVIN